MDKRIEKTIKVIYDAFKVTLERKPYGEITIQDINLLLCDSLEKPVKVTVKTRYSAKMAYATAYQNDINTIKIIFDEPQKSPTPGQSAVLYIDDVVLGGGKII